MIKARRTAQPSAIERDFVRKQMVGQVTMGRPKIRNKRPITGARPLIAALKKANGVQTGSKRG